MQHQEQDGGEDSFGYNVQCMGVEQAHGQTHLLVKPPSTSHETHPPLGVSHA